MQRLYNEKMERTAGTLTRAEQRKQTEARILTEARRLFATLGYQRATIRSVAQAAGVNPGLVIHYFGSKQELFNHAAQYTPDELVTGGPAELADSLLAALRVRLEQEPVASLSLLRSMLTHDDAAAIYRSAAEARTAQLAETIPAPDARLRASLLSAIINAVITDRYLLRLTDLTNAEPDDIIRLLQPCFEYLAGRLGDTQPQPSL